MARSRRELAHDVLEDAAVAEVLQLVERIDATDERDLLHLAVAGCLFNDLLREAPNRGIAVEHLSVTADGDFDANGSSGIRYAIEIRSSADRPAIERLVADIEAGAIIPKGLRAGIAVEPVQVRILTD